MTYWDYSEPSADLIAQYRNTLSVCSTVAELLARLEFDEIDEARKFLNPRLSEIEDPFGIENLKAAAERISRALDERQRIVICGDYDVDGVTSTALLVSILRRFGCYPHFIVPLRLEEGYGLSQKAVERALEGGNRPDLFVALDCGTNSNREAEYILSKGCDLLVVDHHQSKQPLPDQTILVNPHVSQTGNSNSRQLCTVGLVFKLAHGLLKVRRELGDARAFEIKLRHYLDFVSMGTVADLVPLRQENRAFARIGLQVLAETRRQGLKCLMKVSGVQPSHGLRPVDVSFRLGPRINASGRLADASVAVELMLSDDPAYSMETSLKLDSFNRERQEIEKNIVNEAIRQIEEDPKERSGLIVYSEDWHPGVVGIVASRVSRTYSRPCIVLGREGEFAKGSGRSVDGINLVEVLQGYASKLGSWGGHPMAVGISVPLDAVEEFRDYFDKAIQAFLDTHEVGQRIQIASWLKLDEVDADLMERLARMQPFGQKNPEPIFGSRGVSFRQRPNVFKDHHFKFSLSDAEGRPIEGIAWKQAERIPPLNTPVDIAYRLAWNTFGRRKTLQMELVDWRDS